MVQRSRCLVERVASPLVGRIVALALRATRRWPSWYEAFEDGRIEQEALRHVFASHAPMPSEGERLWLGIDASRLERPKAHTSADRTVVHKPNLPESRKPMISGWQFSTLVVLPQQPGSWAYILDQQRIASTQTAVEVEIEQIRRSGAAAGIAPGHDVGSLVQLRAVLAGNPTDPGRQALAREEQSRLLPSGSPAHGQTRSPAASDGDRFQCSDESTHGDPDGQWQGKDPNGHSIEVSCWHRLHRRSARDLEVSLIRVERPIETTTKRKERVSWFLWHDQEPLPLWEAWNRYRRRYSQEHGYRFDKQCLLWKRPGLRTPEQFERWSHVVAIAHNQLVLARSLGHVELRPWERSTRACTPQQVRRAMPRILAQLGTPAQAVQPRGKSPGRQPGATVTAATRYEVVRKPKPLPKTE